MSELGPDHERVEWDQAVSSLPLDRENDQVFGRSWKAVCVSVTVPWNFSFIPSRIRGDLPNTRIQNLLHLTFVFFSLLLVTSSPAYLHLLLHFFTFLASSRLLYDSNYPSSPIDLFMTIVWPTPSAYNGTDSHSKLCFLDYPEGEAVSFARNVDKKLLTLWKPQIVWIIYSITRLSIRVGLRYFWAQCKIKI